MIPVKVGDLSLTDTPWDAHGITGWLDSPGATVESTRRLLAGDFAGASRWSGRVVKLTGLLHTRDCVEQQAARDRLVGLFASGRAQPVHVRHGGVETAGEFQIIDQMTLYPMTPQLAEWELSLYAPDPFLYAATQHVSVAAPGTGIGLRFPLFSEGGVLTFGATSAATTGVLVNTGTAPAWPIFWPRGQFQNGWRIWQDGRLIEWNGVAVDVAQSADTARRAVEIWGTDVSQFLTADDFRPIPPGGSAEIRFEPLGGGTGILEATVASTYI